MRVSIVSEYLSDNLGDGIIAESERFLLETLGPSVKVNLVDLSLRRRRPSFTEEWERGSTKLLIGGRIGKFRWITNLANGVVRSKRDMREFRMHFQGSDLVMIGGGQLLFDNNLSFPLKLYRVVKVVEAMPCPFVFLGVGVGEKWSRLGRALASYCVSRAAGIAVRDYESKSRLSTIGRHGESCAVVGDSALFAREAFSLPLTQRRAGEGSVVGLGVMSVHAMLQAEDKEREKAEGQLIEFWIKVVAELENRRRVVKIFCNGNKRDAWLSGKLVARLNARRTATSFYAVERPDSPQALVRIINSVDCVVAFRLHALIVAVSAGKGVVPLAWDSKVNAFLSMIGARGSSSKATLENACFVGKLAADGGLRYSAELVAKAKQSTVSYITDVIAKIDK